MDMTNFEKDRNMDKRTDGFQWMWHYRAKKVQSLYRDLATCWLDNHYGESTSKNLADDETTQKWWNELVDKIPAFKRSVDPNEPGFKDDFKAWGDGTVYSLLFFSTWHLFTHSLTHTSQAVRANQEVR